VNRIRRGKRGRRQVAVGVPDRALTPNAGLAAVTGLCDRLGVIGALDAAVGPVKQRDRGFGEINSASLLADSGQRIIASWSKAARSRWRSGTSVAIS
jgi:hypothetical protein